jgi:S1-C subfamily serine protease
MALHAVCPNCKSGFTLPDAVGGKKVRCKNCQVIFAVQVSAANQLDELEEADPTDDILDVEAVEEVEEVEEVQAVESRYRQKIGTAKNAGIDEVEEVEALEEAPPRAKAASALQKGDPSAVARRTGLTKEKTNPNGPSAIKTQRPAGKGGPLVPDDDHAASTPAPSRGNNMPLIVGATLAGLVILVGGAIGLAFILKGSADPGVATIAPPPPAPIVMPPAPQPPPQVVIPILPAPQPPPPPPSTPPDKEPRSGKISPEDREKVKQATLYLRVTMPDGGKASGSGFFGCAEEPNLILTNAHVVGMLSPDSTLPQRIEVFINSGQPEEDEGQAIVLGVDRSSDLAVLKLQQPTKKQKPLPPPINVKNAEKLAELDDVWVFGFPLGEKLGKEITIRPSSVSSLRKISGTNLLDKIQVNGGMDPGNSGGPVVDTSGSVVGVAVSGIQGRMINFAIPGERVHTILNGRIAEMGMGQPYFTPEKQIGVPVTVALLDPRNLVKEVSLDVWVGNPGPPREPTKTQPTAAPGDTARQRFVLTANGRERKGEMVLPALSDGKIYWVQPVFTNGAGQTQWVAANEYKLSSQPVERKPADLVFRPRPNVHKDLLLNLDRNFKLSDDEDSIVGGSKTNVAFDAVSAAGPQGTWVVLTYLDANKTNIVKVADRGTPDDFKKVPSELYAKIGGAYKRLRVRQIYDQTGNLQSSKLDPTSIVPGTAPQAIELLQDFHRPIGEALNSVGVSLPNKNGVAVNESWKADRNFPLETADKLYIATFNMTYTYVGQRKRDNRDEAVISIGGDLKSIDGKNEKIAANMSGTALVDLATGELIMCRTNMVMERQHTIKTSDGSVTAKVRITTETRVEYKAKQ